MARVVVRAACSLALGALVAGTALSPPAQGGQAAPVVGRGQSSATAANATLTAGLVRELRSKNLQVTRGYTHLMTPADCDNYTYPKLRNCFGNNPASPYEIPIVKRWPGEYADPRTENAFGRTRPGYTATHRLDRREAVIVFGQLPPPARFFSLQTWMFGQQGGWTAENYDRIALVAPDLAGYLYTSMPPSATQTGRIVSWSSVNDPIDNAVIKRQSGAVWNRTRYFVSTPDRNMDRVVRAALRHLGVAGKNVFTDGISLRDQYGSIGRIGLTRPADDFISLLRYTMPQDEQAGDAWLEHPPLTVLRVREQPSSPRPAAQFPAQVVSPRTANPEQWLADSQQQLVKAVCARAAQGPWKLDLTNSGCDEVAPYPSSTMHDLLNELGQSGPLCRTIGMDCLGDNPDASYFFAPARKLDGGQVYAVLGTLGTQTGNGTYVGLSVNDASRLKGVLNVPDTDTSAPATDLTGSASSYAGVPNSQKLFVHFFSRDCSGLQGLTRGTCSEIPYAMVAKAGDDAAQGNPSAHGMVNYALRTYLKPGSELGPDPALQLKGRVLEFTRR